MESSHLPHTYPTRQCKVTFLVQLPRQGYGSSLREVGGSLELSLRLDTDTLDDDSAAGRAGDPNINRIGSEAAGVFKEVVLLSSGSNP